MIAGLGHDVVNVAQFAEQMREGNGWRALFSVRELRQCSLRSDTKHDYEALHIAARWAGKEAVIKAWCEALAWCNTDYTTGYSTNYTTDYPTNYTANHTADYHTDYTANHPADYPYTLDNMPWSGIEILDDSHGCPRVQLAQEVQNKLCASLSQKFTGLAKVTELTKVTKVTELADSANSADSVKLTDLAKLADSADSANSAKLADSAKFADSTKLAESNRLAGLNNIPNATADIRNAIRWHISLTHDGSVQNNTAIASAVAMLEIL